MKLRVLDEQKGRCTGACCRAFPLSFDPSLTAVDVLAALRGNLQRDADVDEYGEPIMWNLNEGSVIADMVLPLYGPYPKDAQSQARFACRHFDGNNCTNYENRPDLCRNHGVCSPCHEPDCTIDSVIYMQRRLRKYWPERGSIHNVEKAYVRDWLLETAQWLRSQQGEV